MATADLRPGQDLAPTDQAPTEPAPAGRAWHLPGQRAGAPLPVAVGAVCWRWCAPDGSGQLLDLALEALDPVEEGTGVVVYLRVGETDDRDLEGDPGVEGVPHGHHGRPEHLHRVDAPLPGRGRDRPVRWKFHQRQAG